MESDFLIRSRRHGLTLIEILVAVAIVGVVLAVATPSLSDLLERRRVIAAANEVADVIHFARSQPNVTADRVTLHFDRDPGNENSDKTSCVAVVTQSGNDKCKCYETPVCSNALSVLLRLYQLPNERGVSFEAGAKSWGTSSKKNTLQFSRSQVVTDGSDIQVTVKGSRSGALLRLEINSLGRVRICSPNDSISGYGKCTNPIEPSS